MMKIIVWDINRMNFICFDIFYESFLRFFLCLVIFVGCVDEDKIEVWKFGFFECSFEVVDGVLVVKGFLFCEDFGGEENFWLRYFGFF